MVWVRFCIRPHFLFFFLHKLIVLLITWFYKHLLFFCLEHLLLLFFVPGRDEAGLQPSEDQFWPLPWGVGCNVGGCSEAVWLRCGMELKVLPRRGEAGSRPSEYQFWPLLWGVRWCKEEVLGCDLQAVGILRCAHLSDIEFQGLYTPMTQWSRFCNKWYCITLTDCNANHASSIFVFMHWFWL